MWPDKNQKKPGGCSCHGSGMAAVPAQDAGNVRTVERARPQAGPPLRSVAYAAPTGPLMKSRAYVDTGAPMRSKPYVEATMGMRSKVYRG